jgi:autotransporter passenger strand-loop-strand repeat protein
MVFFRNVIKAIRLHCHSLPSSCTGRTLAARDTAWRISGGTQFDYGLASGATVFTGSQVVSSGGTAVHDTISGGTVVLETGAVASGGITFASSGTLEVFGSAMPSATISGFTSGDIIDLAAIASGAGGRAVLASGNVLDVLEGGSTYALQLNPSQSFSGDQFVVTSDGSGGTDVTVVPFSATVSSGTLPVSSGHSSNSVHVLSGAILNILSGGTAVGTFVNSGGTDRVSGTETSATLNGGTEIVSRTGVASGTTVLGHSSQTDLGKTVATVLYGGTEIVSSGDTASNTTVYSGGSLLVLSHGLADPATVYSGGSETISKSGTDRGAQISGGIHSQFPSSSFTATVRIHIGSGVDHAQGCIGDCLLGGTGRPGVCSEGRDRGSEREMDGIVQQR